MERTHTVGDQPGEGRLDGLLCSRNARSQKIIRPYYLCYSNHLLRGVAKAALDCAHRAT
jgi:hypothetical protein